MKTRDVAICLRAVNYSDTSQVVTLLTRQHGKLGAMAKGSRRAKSAFDGAVEPFAFGEMMFSASEAHDQLATLTEFVQTGRFRALRMNLTAMHAGLFALELTEVFCQPYDPHPELFDALAETLGRLAEDNTSPAVLSGLVGYQRTLLDEVGIMPRLDACANCGKTAGRIQRDVYFSSLANGLLCSGCEQSFSEKRRVSPSCVNVLSGADEQAAENTLNEVEQVLIYHFTELLHRPPRMARYFKG